MDSNIKGWLLTILRNIWLNQLRRRRNSPEMVQMELGDGVVTDVVHASKGPHNLYVGKMEAGQVRAAIEELPILFREVILLREYERSFVSGYGERHGLPYRYSYVTFREGTGKASFIATRERLTAPIITSIV